MNEPRATGVGNRLGPSSSTPRVAPSASGIGHAFSNDEAAL